VLVAQWAHETAHGASMINFNFGGIKGAGPSGLTTTCRTREGSGVTERSIRDRFRAYESASEGAEDYVKLLSARYGDALAQAGRGDSTAFVAALKRKGYFTGSEQAYARSLATMSESIEREGFAAVGAKTSGPLRQTLAPERSASSRAFLPPRAVGDAPDLDPALAVHARSIAESLEGAVARILADPPA
jgi:flagellum-specific peptidoglycan hydrolase FlgJ